MKWIAILALLAVTACGSDSQAFHSHEGMGPHDGILARQHFGYINCRILDTDSVCLVIVIQVVEMFAGVQQGFGRYTANVQTGSARSGLAVLAGEHIYTGCFQAQLSCADCRDVATGAATNNDQVEFICHVCFLKCCWSPLAGEIN